MNRKAGDHSARVEEVVIALRDVAARLRDNSSQHYKSHDDDPTRDAASLAVEWVANAIDDALDKLRVSK